LNRKYKEIPQRDQGQTKPSDAYAAIKELIAKRALNPGQKLNYQDLSNIIGLSKTPIINALSRLQNEGFVDYETNKGYRIRQINEKEIEELFAIRVELECFNVRNAIQNLNREKFQKLQNTFNLYASYKPPFTDRKKIILDLDYHLEIAQMGGNSYSIMYTKNIIEHIFFRYRLEQGVEHRGDIIELEHRNILECIGERDARGGAGYMRKHLKALQGLMLQYLKDINRSSETKWF
jgi:DNA-binding GntR family transcriptional regulator